MSHQCPFPVRSTDSRCAYRTGGLPGLTLSFALVAALTCFAGIGHADGLAAAQAAPPESVGQPAQFAGQ